MNFGQLQSRAKELCKLEGWTDVSPAPDFARLVNEALEEFSWEAEYQVTNATITLIEDQAVYDLPGAPPDWKRVTDAVYNSSTVMYLTDENQVRREDPNWITRASGQPYRYWLPGSNVIQFWPTPNAEATVTIRGPRADTPLDNDTDTPNCPGHYHEGIALLAAARHGKVYAQGEAQARVAAYVGEARSIIGALTVYLSEQEAPAFQRRVRRGVAERYQFGWYRWIP